MGYRKHVKLEYGQIRRSKAFKGIHLDRFGKFHRVLISEPRNTALVTPTKISDKMGCNRKTALKYLELVVGRPIDGVIVRKPSERYNYFAVSPAG